MSIHAHIESYTTDCDGSISNDYVMTPNDDEIASLHLELQFTERVLSSVVNVYGLWRTGTLKVECDDENSTGKNLTWSEPTEEGHRTIGAYICDGDCDLDARGYRDHRAESMGY